MKDCDNIYYLRGFQKGYQEGMVESISSFKCRLIQFVADHDEDPTSDFCKGYHMALEHLIEEFMEE